MFRAFRSWWSSRSPASPPNEGHSRTASPSEERDQQKYSNRGGQQNPVANFFAGEADLDVKEMAQGSCGHHRRDQEADDVSHPKLDRVHCERLTPAQFTYQVR